MGIPDGQTASCWLRERVIAFVDEGHGHREAARHVRVSPKFVNDLVRLRRETGAIAPRPQGNGGGHGVLVPVQGWIEARLAMRASRRWTRGSLTWRRNTA